MVLSQIFFTFRLGCYCILLKYGHSTVRGICTGQEVKGILFCPAQRDLKDCRNSRQVCSFYSYQVIMFAICWKDLKKLMVIIRVQNLSFINCICYILFIKTICAHTVHTIIYFLQNVQEEVRNCTVVYVYSICVCLFYGYKTACRTSCRNKDKPNVTES